jgi:checkpoint serine/threonine-protein kinase
MWEQSKENVQPVARGRSARKLGEVSDVALKARIIEDKNDTFEQLLRVAKLAVESDSTVETQTVVLTTYMSYSKWARENSPSSHEPCKKILERATEDMKGYTTLKNDPRFIKLWIEYVSIYTIASEDFFFIWQENAPTNHFSLFSSFLPCMSPLLSSHLFLS